MQTHKTRRLGFTLVELVAVSAAVSLLGAQLFDAILQSREAARRSECKNNLKQLGLALHNYHDVTNKLAPGWIGADQNPDEPHVFGLNGWGWQTMLTPYLDQAPLYNTLDFSVSVADEKHAKIVGKTMPVLRCSSDPFRKKTWALKDSEGKEIAQVGTTNYVASFGTGDFSKCEKMKPGEVCQGDGLFFHNSSIGFKDVKDGTANTLAVGERTTSEKVDQMTTWSGVFPKAKSPFARTLGTSDQALDAKEKNVSGYGSGHQGISHFLMMDGSARALKNSMDLKVFQALTTRAGGEEIPE